MLFLSSMIWDSYLLLRRLFYFEELCTHPSWLFVERSSKVTISYPKPWEWCLDKKNLLIPQWKLQNYSISVDKLAVTCPCRSKARTCKNCKCAKENLICPIYCKCMCNCKNNEKPTSSSSWNTFYIQMYVCHSLYKILILID